MSSFVGWLGLWLLLAPIGYLEAAVCNQPANLFLQMWFPLTIIIAVSPKVQGCSVCGWEAFCCTWCLFSDLLVHFSVGSWPGMNIQGSFSALQMEKPHNDSIMTARGPKRRTWEGGRREGKGSRVGSVGVSQREEPDSHSPLLLTSLNHYPCIYLAVKGLLLFLFFSSRSTEGVGK